MQCNSAASVPLLTIIVLKYHCMQLFLTFKKTLYYSSSNMLISSEHFFSNCCPLLSQHWIIEIFIFYGNEH